MQIFIASNNTHKIHEIGKILNLDSKIKIDLISPNDLTENLPEPIEDGSSFIENAQIKAQYYYDKLGINSLADDSGLMVEALDDAPGIYSARYAGGHKNDADNRKKVLEELKDNHYRKAQFVCIICLIIDGEVNTFEGYCKGNIALEECGENGFGYDSIFIPEGYNLTFAEMDEKSKNELSHRNMALAKMKEFLEMVGEN